MLKGRSSRVGNPCEDAGPQDPPDGIGQEEGSPAHPTGPCQEGCIGPEDRDEPSEQHNPCAIAVEDVSGDLDLLLIKSQVVTESPQEAVATEIANPVPDVVADDRRRRGDDEEQPWG